MRKFFMSLAGAGLGCLVLLAWASTSASASATFTVDAFDVNQRLSNLDSGFVTSVLDTTPTFSEEYAVLDFTDGTRGTGGFFGVNNPFPGGLRTTFILEANGQFRVDEDGEYTFRVRHDDGTRLAINGYNVIDFPRLTAPRTSFGTVFLNAGLNDLSGLFFENGGAAVFEVSIASGAGVRNNSAFSLVTAAIPEPATWLMMILGFAIVGLVHKRRNRMAYHLS
ncbi:PA14 domain-containing protein [Kordiimonas sp. SCSIO 12610]|uniref:PA14 domain-containing protein n=1 Tax=Kordiimonas sp. SCSIO 12610 TaxID=2829597 RepID=UPI002108B91D|nr:PA14 domain-containing protein [Kordiimonas sp. SCSIO 12610]UTW56859.1 PEPxxWA-CTERM sorting domain-containing protein [Kordiimonas sp. SCSIO 12610]